MPNPLDKLLDRNTRSNLVGSDSITNRGINTTGSRMYFINIDTGGRLEIQFIPSDMSHERSGNWATADIIGRNDPKYQYVSGNTSFSMGLDFYADEESRTSVMRKVAWLQSLIANDAYRRPAPRVILVMGEMFNKEVWIVEKAKAKYDNLSRPHGYLPQQAYVDIQLNLDPASNRGWGDIKRPYVQARGDGTSPIQLGVPGLGQPRLYVPNETPNTPFGAGSRWSDDINVGSGNNWSDILKRVLQRYRFPGNMDTFKELL